MASFEDAMETQLMLNMCDFSGLLGMSVAEVHALATEAGLAASERNALWEAMQRWPTTERALAPPDSAECASKLTEEEAVIRDGDVSSDDDFDIGQMV